MKYLLEYVRNELVKAVRFSYTTDGDIQVIQMGMQSLNVKSKEILN